MPSAAIVGFREIQSEREPSARVHFACHWGWPSSLFRMRTVPVLWRGMALRSPCVLGAACGKAVGEGAADKLAHRVRGREAVVGGDRAELAHLVLGHADVE